MILFNKNYYYSLENKIVVPLLVSEDKIICVDKQGKTVTVLNQKYLTLMSAPVKGVVTPSFIKKNPAKVTPKPVITKDTAAADKIGTDTPDTSVNTATSTEPTPTEVKPTEPVIVPVSPVITRNDEPELAITRTVVIPPANTSILRKKAKVVVTEEDYI